MQEYDILKEINSYLVKFCLKIALFSHFCAGSDIRTNYIQFLNLGKSRFPPKRFYNINNWPREQKQTLKLRDNSVTWFRNFSHFGKILILLVNLVRLNLVFWQKLEPWLIAYIMQQKQNTLILTWLTDTNFLD